MLAHGVSRGTRYTHHRQAPEGATLHSLHWHFQAAAIAKPVYATDKSIRRVARGHNFLPADVFHKALDPRSVTKPK